MLKKIWNIAWSIIEFLVIIYVIVMTSILLSKNKFGFTQFGNYTMVSVDALGERNIKDSKEGDLLVVKNTNGIKVGDLIYYYAVYDDFYIIRSDVVTDIAEDDLNTLYMVNRDGLVTILGTKVLGKESKLYPNYGGMLKVIESRLGFLFLVLLPILIIFIYQVYEFVMILKYESVDKNTKVSKKEITDII